MEGGVDGRAVLLRRFPSTGEHQKIGAHVVFILITSWGNTTKPGLAR